MTRLPGFRASAACGLMALTLGLSGCELVASFDRGKIDGGAVPPDDAGTDATSVTDGSVDAPATDAHDAAPIVDANDGGTEEDANDGSVDEDANDGGVDEDANDGSVGEDASDAAPDASDAGDASDAASDAGCSDAGDCNDDDVCTTDSCVQGQCHHAAVPVDDGVACTVDSCSASGGVVHLPDDGACTAGANGNKCVVPSCDPTQGCVYPPRSVDDGVACTVDSCDTSTGVVTHVPSVATCTGGTKCETPSCDATKGCQYTPVAIDDGVGCTDDACSLTTGAITHTPNAAHCTAGTKCQTASCDATKDCQYLGVPIDDGIACTADSCNSSTGVVSHVPNDAACPAGTKCQAPKCDASGGCSLVSVAGIDDGVACTDDSCDGATGLITHAPNDGKCPAGNACQVPRCTGTGCALDPLPIDDGVACTVDACDPVGGPSHTPDDTKCAVGSHCDAAQGCVVTNLQSAAISEFQPWSSGGNSGQFVEIANTGAPSNLANATLTDGNGNLVVIHPADDPDGSLKHTLIVAAGAYVYGVPNPASAASIPASATFVYGSPGTSWTIDSAGPYLQLKNQAGAVLSTVDAKTTFQSDPTKTVGPSQFPGVVGKSTQWDAALGAESSGASWCTTFGAADTAGKPNDACATGRINELLVHDASPAGGVTDDGGTFIELATAGGAPIGGMTIALLASNGSTATTLTIPAGTRAPVDGLYVVADADATGTTTRVPNADLLLANAQPLAGGASGASVALKSGSTTLDVVGYGGAPTAKEGNAIHDVTPGTIAIAYGRDDASTDTGDNRTDFNYDPSPTPGSKNGTVAPAILDRDFVDGLATATTVVTFTARDVADVTAVDGVAPGVTSVSASFDGQVDPACVIQAQSAPYGNVTLRCSAAPHAGERGDVTLASPAVLGFASATIAKGWTYTTVNNGGAGDVGYCAIDPPTTVSASAGAAASGFSGEVYQAGTTESNGGAGVLAQVGYGATGSDPTATSWRFTTGSYVGQTGLGNNNNRFGGSIVAPSAGSYAFAWRFSLDDGLSFTYCDVGGNGSTLATPFSASDLGTMTVTP